MKGLWKWARSINIHTLLSLERSPGNPTQGLDLGQLKMQMQSDYKLQPSYAIKRQEELWPLPPPRKKGKLKGILWNLLFQSQHIHNIKPRLQLFNESPCSEKK